MRLFRLLFMRRSSAREAAQILGARGALARKANERAFIRAKCDEMRAAMGKPPIDWSAL